MSDGRMRTIDLDVWNADSFGLIDDATEAILAEVGGDTAPAEALGAHAPATVIIDEPAYAPYESAEVVAHDRGDRLASRVIHAVYSPEVASSSAAGPLAGLARAIARRVRLHLWPGRETLLEHRFGLLAEIAGGKGGEIRGLLAEYLSRNAVDAQAAVAMAIRDFYASIYYWQFIRCTDVRLLDLCGSALCMTTAVDFVGASDDPGMAARTDYLDAASEGLGCLGGAAMRQAVRDIVVSDAFMRTKNAAAEAAAAGTLAEQTESADLLPVVPTEFLAARWWDAAMAPYHRIPLGGSDYGHLGDDLGAFAATRRCDRIARAVDCIIRHDEIVDLIADYIQRECFNELLVALATGGVESVIGYADALAIVIDEALDCRCGEPGHDESAELAMGSCLWYLVVPRYRASRQLRRLSSDDRIGSVFGLPDPSARQQALTATTLRPGHALHAEDWSPLWERPTQNSAATEAATATAVLTRRAVRRMLRAEDYEQAGEQEHAAAYAALTGCARAGAPEQLAALSEQWCALFDTAVNLAAPAVVEHEAVRTARTLIDRVWRFTVVQTADEPVETPEKLFLDVDQAVRGTYRLSPTAAVPVRRAFFGVLSSAVELSGLSPYARLADGVSEVVASGVPVPATMDRQRS